MRRLYDFTTFWKKPVCGHESSWFFPRDLNDHIWAAWSCDLETLETAHAFLKVATKLENSTIF